MVWSTSFFDSVFSWAFISHQLINTRLWLCKLVVFVLAAFIQRTLYHETLQTSLFVSRASPSLHLSWSSATRTPPPAGKLIICWLTWITQYMMDDHFLFSNNTKIKVENFTSIQKFHNVHECERDGWNRPMCRVVHRRFIHHYRHGFYSSWPIIGGVKAWIVSGIWQQSADVLQRF